jgi:hypothetical protein
MKDFIVKCNKLKSNFADVVTSGPGPDVGRVPPVGSQRFILPDACFVPLFLILSTDLSISDQMSIFTNSTVTTLKGKPTVSQLRVAH